MNWLSSPTNHVRPLCMQLETLSAQVGLGSTWAILSAGLRFNFWVIVKALLLNYSVAYGRQGSGSGGGDLGGRGYRNPVCEMAYGRGGGGWVGFYLISSMAS